MTLSTAELVNDLQLRNRAYNLLYMLGDAEPTTARTFLPGEAARLILVAWEAQQGDRSTPLHQRIAQIDPRRLEYVVTGRIG